MDAACTQRKQDITSTLDWLLRQAAVGDTDEKLREQLAAIGQDIERSYARALAAAEDAERQLGAVLSAIRRPK